MNKSEYTSVHIPALVDVEQIIGAKNPRLLRRIPRFVINYLKRVIHQDEVNYVLHTYGEAKQLSGLAFNNAIIEDHWHAQYLPHGLEHLPQDGRYLFASNHPLGAFDGLILMSAIGRRWEHLRFIVNDLLMYLKPFDPLFVPVNKHGRQSADYARLIDHTYASDAQVLYFPAGLCSRRIHGVITDLPWMPNFISKAIHYQRNVVPVFFDGHNSRFFYRLANIRKRLGIKANIEMLYLPDEFFKQKNHTYNLYFGKPIPYETFDKSRSLAAWTQFVRDEVYHMNPNK